MSNASSIKNYIAEAAINPYRICKIGSADGQVLQATGVNDALVGVSTDVGGALGERQDVIHVGIADLQLGGTVTRGDWITSDGNGQGVSAAPAAGVNNNVIGRALISGVSGDIVPVLLSPNRIQG